jgi:hypothetical protein
MIATKWFLNGNRSGARNIPAYKHCGVCSSTAEDVASWVECPDYAWPVVITLVAEDGSETQWTVEREYVAEYRARRKATAQEGNA